MSIRDIPNINGKINGKKQYLKCAKGFFGLFEADLPQNLSVLLFTPQHRKFRLKRHHEFH